MLVLKPKWTIGLHPDLWLNLGADYVNAELTSTSTPLPRIPPFVPGPVWRFDYKGLLLNPEVVMAQDQNRLFPNETRTAGYACVWSLGSYLIADSTLPISFHSTLSIWGQALSEPPLVY